MHNLTRNIVIAILAFFILAGLLSRYNLSLDQPEEIDLGQLATQAQEGRVKSVDVRQDELRIELTDGTKQVTSKESTESFSTLMANYDVDAEALRQVAVKIHAPSGWQFWVQTLAPFLLPLFIIGGFIWLTMRQAAGMNNRAMSFGQTRSREQKETKVKTTFADVAGATEAKQELQEVVEFLKNPKKFTDIGAKIPAGVLLFGHPGTGKTLLARAVAGEANAPFFNISGSEFVEMFVGVGASRVRDLFERAKKVAPAIVFIDEIDAVGRQRGAGLGGSHDEREQTLNQILVEMDGFAGQSGVVVIAATNRPDVLDPALLRPGRFDRQVTLDLPDMNDREAILKVHAQKKPLADDVNLRRIAERTPGMSGADLANVLNEAAILAARRDKKIVSMTECLESIEKVMLGPERRSHVMSDKEKNITAYHEAGHAVIAHFSAGADPVHKVSIISRGRAAGYTLKLPDQDKHFHSLSEFMADIAVALGGHAIEKMTFGEVTTGASSDLRTVTSLARQLVTQYGMSEKLGPRAYGSKEEMVFLGREIHERRDYSEKIAAEIDAEVDRVISESYAVAEKLLRKHKKQVEDVVALLLKQETIEKDEFADLMGSPKA
jgi:cell division protease FtsH